MLKNSLNVIIWIGLSLLVAVWVNKKTDWLKPVADKVVSPVASVSQPVASKNHQQLAPVNANNGYNHGYGYSNGNGNARGNGQAGGNMSFGFGGGGNTNANGYGRGNGYN